MEDITSSLLEYGILGIWTVTLLWQMKSQEKKFDQKESTEMKRNEEDKAAWRRILTLHSEQLNKIEENLSELDKKIEIVVRDSQEARLREAMRNQNKTKYIIKDDK